MFNKVELALREFGGIKVEERGPGRDFARSSFWLDPSLALGETDRFARFEAIVGAPMYPIGEADDGHAFVAMAEDGRVFLLMDELRLIGRSIEEALNALVEGVLPEDAGDVSGEETGDR